MKHHDAVDQCAGDDGWSALCLSVRARCQSSFFALSLQSTRCSAVPAQPPSSHPLHAGTAAGQRVQSSDWFTGRPSYVSDCAGRPSTRPRLVRRCCTPPVRSAALSAQQPPPCRESTASRVRTHTDAGAINEGTQMATMDERWDRRRRIPRCSQPRRRLRGSAVGRSQAQRRLGAAKHRPPASLARSLLPLHHPAAAAALFLWPCRRDSQCADRSSPQQPEWRRPQQRQCGADGSRGYARCMTRAAYRCVVGWSRRQLRLSLILRGCHSWCCCCLVVRMQSNS